MTELIVYRWNKGKGTELVSLGTNLTLKSLRYRSKYQIKLTDSVEFEIQDSGIESQLPLFGEFSNREKV